MKTQLGLLSKIWRKRVDSLLAYRKVTAILDPDSSGVILMDYLHQYLSQFLRQPRKEKEENSQAENEITNDDEHYTISKSFVTTTNANKEKIL